MPSTTSIHTVPPEIIIGIFGFLLPKYLADLQLVCKTWRDILYGMSHLWNSITISRHSTIPMLDVLKMAARRASRAGVLPLTITWEPNLKEDELTDEINAALLDFFRNAPPSRWIKLILHNTSGFTDETMNADFSTLKELSVQVIPAVKGFNARLLQSIDCTAASVETLLMSDNWSVVEANMPNTFKRVTSMEIEDDDINIVLPQNVVEFTTWGLPIHLDEMEHLTHLTIERLQLPWGFELQMPALEYLNIGGTPHEDEDTAITLSFPNLMHLDIPGNAPWLLASIIAPKLQRLELREVWTVRWDESDELSEDEITEQYHTLLLRPERFSLSMKTLILTYKLKVEVSLDMIKKAPRLRKLYLTVVGMEEAIAVIQSILPSSAGNINLNTSEKIDWGTCGSLSSLTLRMNRVAEVRLPPQVTADFTKMCRSIFHLLSINAELERLKIIWPDGTAHIIPEDDDDSSEDTQQE